MLSSKKIWPNPIFNADHILSTKIWHKFQIKKFKFFFTAKKMYFINTENKYIYEGILKGSQADQLPKILYCEV